MCKIEYFKLKELAVEGNGFCKGNYTDTIMEDQLDFLLVLDGQPVSDEYKNQIRAAILRREEEMAEKYTTVGMTQVHVMKRK